MPTAIVTGASRGLGLALARALAERGWRLVVDARVSGPLDEVAAELPDAIAIPGDVTDPEHRAALIAAAGDDLQLLVNNASILGPSPQPHLADYPLDTLEQVYAVNVLAPLALIQLALPHRPRIINLSSDAAEEPYEGWGGYGAAKAALDHLTLTFGVETGLTAYVVDPGDMDTQMHRDAEPGEDLSHLPQPETVVPRILALLDRRPTSGRYRAADIATLTGVSA